MFDKILGLNWKTTLAGLAAIGAIIVRMAAAYRTRDFQSIITDGQLLLENLGILLLALGLIKAKDQNVTGAGAVAKTVDSSGTVTNREGTVVGQQQPVK